MHYQPDYHHPDYHHPPSSQQSPLPSTTYKHVILNTETNIPPTSPSQTQSIPPRGPSTSIAYHPPLTATGDILSVYKNALMQSLPQNSPNVNNKGSKRSNSSNPNAIPEVIKSSYPYSYIRTHFLSFALDQHGSRLIQQHLSAPSPETLSLITNDATPHLLALSTDVFGNYIIQKIIQTSTSLSDTIVEFLTSNVISLCHDQYGCRVIQASFCHNRILHVVASELHSQGMTKDMLTHVNGNHVVQKIVQLSGPHTYNLAGILQGDVDNLSKDQYGCRFVQRMIEGGWGEHIEWDVKSCINHQYGNYIIQHLLTYGSAVSKKKVFSTILRLGIVSLCKQKYSSNVMEKLLVNGSPSHVGYVMNALSSFEMDGVPVCVKLAQDPYGNYVVRKATEVVGGHNIQAMLKERMNDFKGSAYAKRVIAKIT